MEFISLNPKTYVGDHFHAAIQVMLTVCPPIGIADTPELAFGSPPMVALALVAHVVAVDRGSWRH